MPRAIKTHHDGFGLNESIELTAVDEPGPGGANHYYEARIDGKLVCVVQFQRGPRLEPSSDPGVTDTLLLAIVADRMASLNAGEFSCRENALVRTKVEEAMLWLYHRAKERMQRGVLGVNAK